MEEEKFVSNIVKSMEKMVTNNNDGTYNVKMPGSSECYVIKDLTTEEEYKAKRLATQDIPEDMMCVIRSIVSPKIATDDWNKLPAKITKRLFYAKKFIDGEFDFLA